MKETKHTKLNTKESEKKKKKHHRYFLHIPEEDY